MFDHRNRKDLIRIRFQLRKNSIEKEISIILYSHWYEFDRYLLLTVLYWQLALWKVKSSFDVSSPLIVFKDKSFPLLHFLFIRMPMLYRLCFIAYYALQGDKYAYSFSWRLLFFSSISIVEYRCAPFRSSMIFIRSSFFDDRHRKEKNTPVLFRLDLRSTYLARFFLLFYTVRQIQ